MFTQADLLLEALPQAILRLDQEGYICFANKAATQLTQYDSHELLNQHISLVYSPHSDTIKANYELGIAKQNGCFKVEGWRLKKDHSRFWGELTLSWLVEQQTGLVGYSCLLVDTTHRKQQELNLQSREERYRLLVDRVIDYGIFMLDPLGHILTWNEGAERIKGYRANEIIGQHFSTFYTAQDLAAQKPDYELAIAIQTGKYEEEGWRVKKNGSVFWANIVITALFNEQNQHIGFSKVTRDLTERKQAQEALQQSEERYRSLVEQVADYGIFMMDEKGRVINWNEGAKRIKGYTAEEILGKYFSVFYPQEDIHNGKPAHELRIALETGKYEEEGWRIRKDGRPFWASVVITALYNPQGIHIGFSKVTRDLTERKKAEESLRESVMRYRQLANELRERNIELTVANEELEQFTSIVSHDLQEPIRTNKSFLLMIERQLGPAASEDLKSYIQKALHSATRMKELIHYLLQYSQLGKGEFTRQNIPVADLLEEVLQTVSGTMEATQSQIELDLQVDQVYGNRLQLVQLLQNLVSNALKFTTGCPQVRICCQTDRGQVKFSVADNGIGIAPDNFFKVFGAFQRLPTEQRYEGSGMGLAICKKITEQHGGQIWPESKLGLGTTFYVTLNQAPTKTEVL